MTADVVPFRPVVRPIPVAAWWGAAGLLLGAMELTNSASIEFSGLVMLFTFITGFAVQAFGGLTSLFGFATLVFSVENVLFSQVAKAVLREPPEARLQVPLVTMGAYCVGLASLAVGAYIGRRLQLKGGKSVFGLVTDYQSLRTLAIVTTVLAVVRAGGLILFGYSDSGIGLETGGFAGVLRQLGFLELLPVAAGTAALIVKNPKRSIGALNVVPLCLQIFVSFIGAGRQGMVFAAIAYVVTALAFGFRFKPQHLVGLAVGTYIFIFIVSPYSLVARSQIRSSDSAKNFQRSIYLLGDVIANPGKYGEDTTAAQANIPIEYKLARYYPFPSNLLERYAIIKNADAIIGATVYRGTMGWRTIIPGFEMLPPSFLYPDKPQISTTNLLAHRGKGLLNENDLVTGITVGWVSDCFSSFSWLGVAIIPAIFGAGYVIFYSFVINTNLKRNVFAISVIHGLLPAFCEGSIQTAIVTIIQQSIVLLIGFGFVYFAIALTKGTYLRRPKVGQRLGEEPAATAS